MRDLTAVGFAEWSVHLDAYAVGGSADQHLHNKARIQSLDAYKSIRTSVYPKGGQTCPAM